MNGQSIFLAVSMILILLQPIILPHHSSNISCVKSAWAASIGRSNDVSFETFSDVLQVSQVAVETKFPFGGSKMSDAKVTCLRRWLTLETLTKQFLLPCSA